MIKEIGSEFWASDKQKICDKRFFMSGRTALEYIVRDIKMRNATDSVLLPSYCCHTMIEPFVRQGFSIRFYDAFFSKEQGCLKAELPLYNENEVLFYISYFGFSPISGLNLNELRHKFKIIIDDRTHSWLRTEETEAQPDYSFTSFRKWGAFSGFSECCKYGGDFLPVPGDKSSERYVYMRDDAFGRKAYYMEHGGSKESFLRLFGEAEMMLEGDYENYRPSYSTIDAFFSTNWKMIRNRRRENAKYLLGRLSGIKKIQLPFNRLEEADAPLFVPILVDDCRDVLRKYLIEHNVYCPVHWPISVLHDKISKRACELYSAELSLLCDQRYGQEEMERIISLVEEFFG